MFPFIVATIAPIVNCIQWVPQLYKTYATKSVKDLSMHSLMLILATNLLWLTHGYFTPLDILNADHKGRRIECCLGKRYFETDKLPFTYQ